jgi:hypothetical protein
MRTKFILSVMFSAVFALFMGGSIAVFAGIPELALPASGVLMAVSFVPMPQMGGLVMETFYRQVWEKAAFKSIDSAMKDTFLDGIPDKSQYVTGSEEMQTINSLFFGVEPDVLINNTTYPIPLQELNGTPVSITLDKYQTKVTPVTEDEMFALAYDKISEVVNSHTGAIIKNRLKKSIHALAPAGDTVKTPVLLTTGAATGDGLRLRLKWDDLVRLREAWTAAGFAIEDLRLVLCADHVNDLLLADLAFQKSYANFQNGIITNQLGFEMREYAANPYFNVTTKAKLSFGGVVTTDHRQASVVFNKGLARKAAGMIKTYKDLPDAQNQRYLIAMRNFFICMPSIQQEIGAIVSGKPAV